MRVMSAPKSINEVMFLRFKSGDEQAFEKIFKSDYNAIVGFCCQFIGDYDIAKGHAQEAFINLWTNRQKIESVNGIKSFLYTYAKSACLNYIRHKKVISRYQDKQLQKIENQLNMDVLESFDFNSLEFTELENLIQASVDSLPEKCQRVFIMSRFEGKKNKEIAEELGISVKSVEANITRSLNAIKRKLSDYLVICVLQIIWLFF